MALKANKNVFKNDSDVLQVSAVTKAQVLCIHLRECVLKPK